MLKQGNFHIHFRFYVLGRLMSGQGVENTETFWFAHYQKNKDLSFRKSMEMAMLTFES